MKLNNNDDSHNSGLNLLIYNMLLDIESHPAWVCGLKPLGNWCCWFQTCHTLRGCVDWNFSGISYSFLYHCHTLRGCVDWNIHLENFSMAVIVTPCVGVWIETLSKQPRQLLYPVTPCVGVWIETTGRSPYVATDGGSHPAWVCGLKRMCKLHQ